MSRNYSRLWILLVLCIGMSIAAPVTTAPTQSENITGSSVDRSDNNERFGPTTISSLVVAVLGAVFGLLSLVPLWMWWMMRIRCKGRDETAPSLIVNDTPSSHASSEQRPRHIIQPDSNSPVPNISEFYAQDPASHPAEYTATPPTPSQPAISHPKPTSLVHTFPVPAPPLPASLLPIPAPVATFINAHGGSPNFPAVSELQVQGTNRNPHHLPYQ